MRRVDRNRYSLINKAGLDRLRVSIFRSCKHVHAQIIDRDGNVMHEVSSARKDCSVKTKMEKAIWVAKELAKNIQKDQKFFYDRGGYAYHGVVKAFADAARESGMEF